MAAATREKGRASAAGVPGGGVKGKHGGGHKGGGGAERRGGSLGGGCRGTEGGLDVTELEVTAGARWRRPHMGGSMWARMVPG